MDSNFSRESFCVTTILVGHELFSSDPWAEGVVKAPNFDPVGLTGQIARSARRALALSQRCHNEVRIGESTGDSKRRFLLVGAI
jgi:hypothetical protein